MQRNATSAHSLYFVCEAQKQNFYVDRGFNKKVETATFCVNTT